MSSATYFLEWNSDFVLTPNGSIQTAVNWDQVRQRIIRHALTNSATPLPDGSTTPPDYFFSTLYGISGGALVDQNPTRAFLNNLKRRIRQAVLEDIAVNPGSVPAVQFKRPQPNLFEIFVEVDLIDGTQGRVVITVGG